mmetsp:Transcript_25597/g.44678  ORF Transcript_25597/g.44678 Transcript_25597/m.44678 type:complete len:361 (+) Transcript_25597:8675-9757(+)
MLHSPDQYASALERRNHAKLLQGCTLEELVFMQVPTMYRDPLFTKQQLPLFNYKRVKDRRAKSVHLEASLTSELASRPVSRDTVAGSGAKPAGRVDNEEDGETEVFLEDQGLTIKRSKFPKVELNQQLYDCFTLIKAYDKIERIYDKRGRPIVKPLQTPLISVKASPDKPTDIAQVKRLKDRCHACDKLSCVCEVKSQDEYLDHMNRLFVRSRMKSRETEEKLKARVKKASTVSPSRIIHKKLLRLKVPTKESDLHLFVPPAMKNLINSAESLASVPTTLAPIYQTPKGNRLQLPEINLQNALQYLGNERATSNLTPKGSRILRAKQTIFKNVPGDIEKVSVAMDDIVMVTPIGAKPTAK